MDFSNFESRKKLPNECLSIQRTETRNNSYPVSAVYNSFPSFSGAYSNGPSQAFFSLSSHSPVLNEDFFNIPSPVNGVSHFVLRLPEEQSDFDSSLVPFARINSKSEFKYEPGCTYRKDNCTIIKNPDGSEMPLDGILNHVCYYYLPKVSNDVILADAKDLSYSLIHNHNLLQSVIHSELAKGLKKAYYYAGGFFDKLFGYKSKPIEHHLQKEIDLIVGMNFLLANTAFKNRREYKNREKYRQILSNDLSKNTKQNNLEVYDLLKKVAAYKGLIQSLSQKRDSAQIFDLENKIHGLQDELREHSSNINNSKKSVEMNQCGRNFLVDYKSLLWKTVEISESILAKGVDLENHVRRTRMTYVLLKNTNSSLSPFASNVDSIATLLLDLDKVIASQIVNLKKLDLDYNQLDFFLRHGDMNTIDVLTSLKLNMPIRAVEGERLRKDVHTDFVAQDLADFEKNVSKR